MSDVRRPLAMLAIALLAVTTSGSIVLGYAGDGWAGGPVREHDADLRGGHPTGSHAPEASGSPRPSQEGDLDVGHGDGDDRQGGEDREGDDHGSSERTPCTYGPQPSHTASPKPTPASPSTRTTGAGALVLITGVVTAEGWVPPPGETCPPEP
jgi:hypothetical protein